MEQDTLITFMLDCAPGTASVDLYGSWDNFHKAYPLRKDKQMGHGRWFGCHQFTSIICDGDPSHCCSPRNGALRIGGTYWFYYKVNDDLECPNVCSPTTSNCPLLPGQIVNVLEVPTLVADGTQQELGDFGPLMTLDPKGRNTMFGRPRKSRHSSRNSVTCSKPASRGYRCRSLRDGVRRLQSASVYNHVARPLDYLGFVMFDHLNRRQRPKSAPVLLHHMNDSEGRAYTRQAPKGLLVHPPTPPSEQQATPSTTARPWFKGHHSGMSRTFTNPFRRAEHRRQGATESTNKLGHRDSDVLQLSRRPRPASAPMESRATPDDRSRLRPRTEPNPMQRRLGSMLALQLGPQAQFPVPPQMQSANSSPRNGNVAESSTASPSPTPSFWGSPLLTGETPLSSPCESNHEQVRQRRRSQLYSLSSSRDGVGSMLNSPQISSQETITQARLDEQNLPPSDRSTDTMDSGLYLTQTKIAGTTTQDEAERIYHDLNYLGSAIS